MPPVTIQDALDYCLINPDGLSATQLLAKFPEYKLELEPLLALSASITSTIPLVPEDHRVAMKQRLMNVAAAKRPATVPPVQPQRQSWWQQWTKRPVYALAGIAVVLIAFVWWASLGSLPGSPLYNVKLTAEEIRLNLAGSPSAKLEEHLNAANTRLSELTELGRQGKLSEGSAALQNYRSHITNSSNLLAQTAGSTRTEVARKLLISSSAGTIELARLLPELQKLGGSIHENASQALQALDSLRDTSAQTLILARLDPNDVLRDANIDPSTLPTQLPKLASGTVTPSVPAVAVAPTQTAGALATLAAQTAVAANASQTGIASAARATAGAIVGQTAVSPSRLAAARTVLAGGSGTGMLSAQQTVLAAEPTDLPTQPPSSTPVPPKTTLRPSTPTRQIPTPQHASPTPLRPTITLSPRAIRTATPVRTVPVPTRVAPTFTSVLPTRIIVPTPRPTFTSVPPVPSPTQPPIGPPTPVRTLTGTVAPTLTPILLQTVIPPPTEIPSGPTIVPPLLPTLTVQFPSNTVVPTAVLITPFPLTPPPLTTLPLQTTPTRVLPSVTPPPIPTRFCPLEVDEV